MVSFRGLRCGAVIGALLTCGGAAMVAGDAAAQQAPQRRAWLGVAMDVDAQTGVRVKHVVRSSPAHKAGIREGDRLLKVDGVRVSTASEVVRLVSSHSVGEEVPVVLQRDGKEQGARVTLADFPSSDEMMRMDHLNAFAPAWKNVAQVSGNVPASLGALRGRVVLIDFWATWCGPCRLVAPKLSALQARYGAQGLSVIGLSTEGPEEVALFAQRMGMTYGIGVDKKGETSSAYTVSSLPTMFLVDKKGVVRDISVGYDPSREAQTEALIKALLAEPAPTD